MPYLKEQPSWDQVYAGISRIAKDRGEWAGMPMPVKGLSMTIHKSYPFAEDFANVFMPEPQTRVCRNSVIDETTTLRNSFFSNRLQAHINIWRDNKGSFYTFGKRVTAAPMVLNTLMASRSWDIKAEQTAVELLRSLITPQAFNAYYLTGTFIETSKRSRVIYMFRRLRPTIAMTSRPDKNGRDDGVRILTCLCLHPIGFFNDSFAGCLCPTDDVIAHLMLMRGDEKLFWRQANHRHPLEPEAGV